MEQADQSASAAATPQETLEYMADLVLELREIAHRERLPALAALLDLAYREVVTRARGSTCAPDAPSEPHT